MYSSTSPISSFGSQSLWNSVMALVLHSSLNHKRTQYTKVRMTKRWPEVMEATLLPFNATDTLYNIYNENVNQSLWTELKPEAFHHLMAVAGPGWDLLVRMSHHRLKFHWLTSPNTTESISTKSWKCQIVL